MFEFMRFMFDYKKPFRLPSTGLRIKKIRIDNEYAMNHEVMPETFCNFKTSISETGNPCASAFINIALL